MTGTLQESDVYILSPNLNSKDDKMIEIQQRANIQLHLIDYSKLLKNTFFLSAHTILIDARFDEHILDKLQGHSSLKQASSIALFFAPKTVNLASLAKWHNLAGYFYQSDSIEFIAQELKGILQGQNKLPKSLLLALLKYWQNIYYQQHSQAVETKLSLTCREMEILTKLRIGQSNLDIADSLFISEHTIKSHLYRIFKKLRVSNRRQAINWAQLYL